MKRIGCMTRVCLVLVVSSGCDVPPGSTSAPVPPSNTTPTISIQDKAAWDGLHVRVAKLGEKAVAAMKLDGTAEAEATRNLVATCPAEKNVCVERAKTLAQTRSSVGASVGLAGYLLQMATEANRQQPNIHNFEQYLQVAEELVDRATIEAQKAADARVAQERKAQDAQEAQDREQREIADERTKVDAASKACDQSGPAACQKKCDAGDLPTCWTLAASLSTNHKLREAKALYEKTCSAGFVLSCKAIRVVDQDIQNEAARLDSLWSDVASVGDELAQKRHVTTIAAQMAANPRLQRSLPQMRAINQAIVVERFCPAKKTFVASAGVAEFQRRASAQCQNEAPTGQGLSGASVTLTTECQGVYAISCP